MESCRADMEAYAGSAYWQARKASIDARIKERTQGGCQQVQPDRQRQHI